MKDELKKIINKCGCIDIKVVVLLFFILVAIYAMYQEQVKDEDCQCGN
tara:strand:+ start:2288 stop:2431 length:144 start_codon:yes stop_codon:yes gene_type:complete